MVPRPVRSACVVAAAVLAIGAAGCRKRTPDPVRVFVSNEDSGDVSVIDAARDVVVATIPVGRRPRGLRVSPDGKLLYVAVSGAPKGGPPAKRGEDVAAIPAKAVERKTAAPKATPADHDDTRAEYAENADGVAVVDLDRGTVLRTLRAGRDPEAFDLSPDGRTLYVSNEDSATLTVLDATNGAVNATVRVGEEPEGVTVSRDGRFVYVACEGTSEVVVVEARTNTVVTRVPTASRPRAIAFHVDGTRALVTAETGGAVDVLDAQSHAAVGRVRMESSTARPMGIALSSDGDHAWVANGRDGSVAELDVAARKVARTIHGIGTRPWGVALAPDDKKLYVAAGPDLAVVDTTTGAVVKRIPVGTGPWGVVTSRRSPR